MNAFAFAGVDSSANSRPEWPTERAGKIDDFVIVGHQRPILARCECESWGIEELPRFGCPPAQPLGGKN